MPKVPPSNAAATPQTSAQARHNATERQRVKKLKEAFLALDDVIRSRPDLSCRMRPTAEEPASKRCRSASISPVAAADGSACPGTTEEGGHGRSGKAPQGPSHFAILQESATAVGELYDLVDELTRRNEELERQIQAAGEAPPNRPA